MISMSVYLAVRLSARISQELHARCLPNVWCMLPSVVARSSSGQGGEVCSLRLPCIALYHIYAHARFTFFIRY